MKNILMRKIVLAGIIAGLTLTPISFASADFYGDVYLSGTGSYVPVVVDRETGETVQYGGDYKSRDRAQRKADRMAKKKNGVVDNGDAECDVVLC
jgi:hypothetical protein